MCVDMSVCLCVCLKESTGAMLTLGHSCETSVIPVPTVCFVEG